MQVSSIYKGLVPPEIPLVLSGKKNYLVLKSNKIILYSRIKTS